MYIFQPDRFLLFQQIKKYSFYIKGKVLDVGAGDFSRYRGLFTCEEYIKLDIKKSENIDVVGRVEDLPFKNDSFDSVVCTQVFEHVDNPFKAASEIYRVLKKGGHCLITVPQTNELHEEPYDYFRYTKFGLTKMFTKQGFEILKCEQRGGFFSLCSQFIIRYLIDRFRLYQKKILGRFLNIFLKIFGRFMIFLDKLDKSRANRKHTIGWCLVLRK